MPHRRPPPFRLSVAVLIEAEDASGFSAPMLWLSDVAARHGLPVRVAMNVVELSQLSAPPGTVHVLLVCVERLADPAFLAFVAHLRDRLTLQVLALGGSAAALQAGADMVLGYPASETAFLACLAAVPRNLTARGEQRRPDGPGGARESAQAAPAPWLLCSEGWVLRAPDGHALTLTRQQRALVKELLAADGRPGPLASIRGHEGGPGEGRQLAMTVSRLKRSGRAAAMRIPIRAVRGVGYQFTAPCIVVPDTSVGTGSGAAKTARA